MKIQHKNQNELEIKKSGIIQFIFGIIISLGGLAAGIYSIITLIKGDFNFIFLILAIFGLVIGLITVFFTKTITISLTKDGPCRVEEKSILTKKSGTTSFNANDVASVNLEAQDSLEYRSGTNNSSNNSSFSSERDGIQIQTKSVLYIKLKDGTSIPLLENTKNKDRSNITPASMAFSAFRTPLKREGDEVANFFGMQLIYNKKSLVDMGDAINGVKSIFNSFTNKNNQSSNQQNPAVNQTQSQNQRTMNDQNTNLNQNTYQQNTPIQNNTNQQDLNNQNQINQPSEQNAIRQQNINQKTN